MRRNLTLLLFILAWFGFAALWGWVDTQMERVDDETVWHAPKPNLVDGPQTYYVTADDKLGKVQDCSQEHPCSIPKVFGLVGDEGLVKGHPGTYTVEGN